MNSTRLQGIIESYINRFDELIDPDMPYNEDEKWRVICSFKKLFTFETDDFVNMFREATKKIATESNIINGGTVQPLNGILELLKYEPDTVRELFEELYADDGGDLKKRQDKIEMFMDGANKLLDQYEHGKWKYTQDFRSVLAYLVMYKPEENYLYKASEIQPFMRYLEFGEELGYGSNFSLERYYRMCDAIREELKSNAELMKTDATRYRGEIFDLKDDSRLLTFDVMYCAQAYEFYPCDEYKKSVKLTGKQAREKQRVAQKEAAMRELEELQEKLGVLQVEQDAIPEINMSGMQVSHKTFGSGSVVNQRGTYLDIEFPVGIKMFKIPDCVAQKFIATDDDAINDLCDKLSVNITEMEKIKKRISSLEREIERE